MLPKKPFQQVWYEGPGWVKIKLEPSEVRRIAHYPDAVLVKEINGETFEAIVPEHTIGENDTHSWIPAEYAGSLKGKAAFYLPVGNDGRTTWWIPEEALSQILLS